MSKTKMQLYQRKNNIPVNITFARFMYCGALNAKYEECSQAEQRRIKFAVAELMDKFNEVGEGQSDDD